MSAIKNEPVLFLLCVTAPYESTNFSKVFFFFLVNYKTIDLHIWDHDANQRMEMLVPPSWVIWLIRPRTQSKET